MGRKWSLSSKLFGLLSVAFAVAAFLLVRGYAERVRALEPGGRDPVPVLVAERDLSRGTVVEDDMLRGVSVPSAYAPPGAVDQAVRARGRVLIAGLAEGEPLTETRLAPRGTGPVAA